MSTKLLTVQVYITSYKYLCLRRAHKWPEIEPQSTPEALDEAIALKKYAGDDSEVEQACCEAWGVDFDEFQLQGIEVIFPLYSHSTPLHRRIPRDPAASR